MKKITKKVCSLIILVCLLFVSSLLATSIIIKNYDVDSFAQKAHAIESTDSIEFVYQKNTDIYLGQTQDVCVGFNNQSHPDAKLNYSKVGTDKNFSVPAIETIDEMSFFQIDANNAEDIGTYNLTSVTWYDESNNMVVQYLEENCNTGYSFSINEKVSDSNTAESPASVYSITENGLKECTNLNDNSQTAFYTTSGVIKEKYQESLANDQNFVVAIDAGHGGYDSGACYGDYQEKNLNYQIAVACQNELSQYMGVSVVLTRDGDEYVGLKERADRARNAGANLFVSLHNNTGGGTGSEVWVQHSGGWHSEFNTIGSDIGSRILQKLNSNLGLRNRGLKEKYYPERTYPDGSPGDFYETLYWTRYYSIPGILVEHAFMDGSAVDKAALYNLENLNAIGKLDAQAIAEYYGFQKDCQPTPYVEKMEDKKVKLAWDSIKGAQKYAIARYENGNYYTYSTECTDTSYSIEGLTNGEKYAFLVQAYVNGQWSKYSEVNHLVFRLLPCPVITATASDDGEITLSWPTLSGSSKYAIAEYYDGEYLTYTDSFASDKSVIEYKIDNLECGVEYQFLVQGFFKHQWWSSYDSSSHTHVVPEGHMKPYNVQSEIGQIDCTLSWSPVPGALSYVVSSLQPDGKWHTHTYYCTDTSFLIGGLRPESSYTFLVQARFRENRFSAFDSSDYINIVTKDFKPRPYVDSMGDGTVKLKWESSPHITKYAIAEYLGGNSYKSYTQECGDSEYQIENLANNYEHTFVVQAFYDDAWTKIDSNLFVKATPTGTIKPSVTSTSVAGTSITLNWNHVPGAAFYTVATQNDDGQSYTTYTCDHPDTTYTITGLEDSKTYKCLVQANINGNWSKFDDSDLVEVSTKVTRPAPTATPTGDGKVTLSWEAIEGAENYVAYEVVGDKYLQIGDILPSTTLTVTKDNLANNYEHTFLVQAKVGGQWSKYSERNYVKATPTGTIKPSITSTSVTGNTITLNWNKVPGAAFYAIATQNDDGQSYTTYTCDHPDTTYTITGLEDSKTYKCLVQANINGKWSNFDNSDLVEATTKVTRPVVTAEPSGDGKVKLTWEAIEGAQNYVAYEIVGSQYLQIGDILPSTTLTVTKDNLANDYEHTFLVQAKVGGQWSKFSERNYAKATPTGTIKPTLNTPTVSGTTINLAWNKVPGASAYAVATKVGDSKYTTYTMTETSTSYSIKGLEENVTYDCLVQSNINGKWSSFSGDDHVEATTKGTRPVVTAEPSGDGQVTLSWEAIEGAENYVAYEVIGDKYLQIGDILPSTTLTVTKDNLANNYEHTFLVQAKVGGTWSKYSERNYVKATPTGTIKPTITSTSVTGNTITLNWNKVPGAAFYAIATQNDDGQSYTTYTCDHPDTTYTITGLEDSKTYKCLVQANINGKWSNFDDSDLVEVSTPILRPITKVKSVGDGTVTLEWSSVPRAAKYAVYEYKNGSFKTLADSCTATEYTTTNLSNNKEHVFLVRASVDGILSPFSEKDYVRATPIGREKPEITRIAPGIHSLSMAWTPVSGAEKYAIATTCDMVNYVTYSSDCTATSYEIKGLKGGVMLYCLVQAYIDGKWSAYCQSDHVSATPLIDPERPQPTVTSVTYGQVTLQWVAIPNATKYAIASKVSEGVYKTYTLDCKNTTYTVTGLQGGQYQFLVQAYVNNKWSNYGDEDLVSANVPSSEGTYIMSGARTSIDQMVRYWNSTGAVYPSNVYASRGAGDIQTWCTIAYQEATAEGVDPAVLFCQAMKETGWLRFGGQVKPEQCNFGGMGATDGGAGGASFPDVRTGLRAQVQHLKAYACKDSLVNPCVDPRFNYVNRGCAPTVEMLGGRWASNPTYGYELVDMMNVLFKK